MRPAWGSGKHSKFRGTGSQGKRISMTHESVSMYRCIRTRGPRFTRGPKTAASRERVGPAVDNGPSGRETTLSTHRRLVIRRPEGTPHHGPLPPAGRAAGPAPGTDGDAG